MSEDQSDIFDIEDPNEIVDAAEGQTRLWYAIDKDKTLDNIRALLESGADPNICNVDGMSPMGNALEQAWHHVAKLLLEYGGWRFPEEKDPDELFNRNVGTTRLLFALEHCEDIEVIRKCLDAGADPNKPDKFGTFPLSLARLLKWQEAEGLLIKHGADPSVPAIDVNQLLKLSDFKTRSRLSHAIENATSLRLPRALLMAGADPNIIDSATPEEPGGHDSRPFFVAIKRGRLSMVELLLKHGARYDLPNNNTGTYPVHDTIYGQHDKIAEYLLRRFPKQIPNQRTEIQGATPLHLAAAHRLLHIVQLLIDLGANVNEENDDGETPLHWAVSQGQNDIVRLLIKNGADVDSKPRSGKANSILIKALGKFACATPETVEVLIRHGADVNERTKGDGSVPENWTPLYMAASNEKHHDKLKILLEAGADPHAEVPVGFDEGRMSIMKWASKTGNQALFDAMGLSPLHAQAANRECDKTLIRRFLDNGASLTVRDPVKNQTPVDLALELGNSGFFEAIGQEMIMAVNALDEDTAMDLVRRGRDPNAVCDLNRDNLLGWMTRSNNKIEQVELLLRIGADPNAKDGDGCTAYDIAKESHNERALQLFKAYQKKRIPGAVTTPAI